MAVMEEALCDLLLLLSFVFFVLSKSNWIPPQMCTMFAESLDLMYWDSKMILL